MPANLQTEIHFNRLTWPEMNDAIAEQKLVILPTASTEQHGTLYAPTCESDCLRGQRIADSGKCG